VHETKDSTGVPALTTTNLITNALKYTYMWHVALANKFVDANPGTPVLSLIALL